jgi:hypothetical protein
MIAGHHRRARGALLLAAVALALPARADSLRCDGGLVSVGDAKLDLLGKCGLPTLREAEGAERRRVQVDASGRTVAGQATAGTVERWTYNFGPRAFVQVITLSAGRVEAIERGAYGYDLGPSAAPPAIPRSRCDQLAFHVGDTAFDLLARCGEPATRDLELVTLTSGAMSGGDRFEGSQRTVTVEHWTYDLGPQAFTRRLVLEAGRVISVGTGGYGYSRPESR